MSDGMCVLLCVVRVRVCVVCGTAPVAGSGGVDGSGSTVPVVVAGLLGTRRPLLAAAELQLAGRGSCLPGTRAGGVLVVLAAWLAISKRKRAIADALAPAEAQVPTTGPVFCPALHFASADPACRGGQYRRVRPLPLSCGIPMPQIALATRTSITPWCKAATTTLKWCGGLARIQMYRSDHSAVSPAHPGGCGLALYGRLLQLLTARLADEAPGPSPQVRSGRLRGPPVLCSPLTGLTCAGRAATGRGAQPQLLGVGLQGPHRL